jgi:hypothetical protein
MLRHFYLFLLLKSIGIAYEANMRKLKSREKTDQLQASGLRKNTKRSKIYVIGISEGKEKECQAEKIFQKTFKTNFYKMHKATGSRN